MRQWYRLFEIFNKRNGKVANAVSTDNRRGIKVKPGTTKLDTLLKPCQAIALLDGGLHFSSELGCNMPHRQSSLERDVPSSFFWWGQPTQHECLVEQFRFGMRARHEHVWKKSENHIPRRRSSWGSSSRGSTRS